MMKRLLAAATIVASLATHAQEMPYTFSVLNEEYTELSEAVSAVDNETWDDPNSFVPIGFYFQLIDETINSLYLTAPGSQIISTALQDSVHFLQPYLADIIDVGYDTAAISPIRYATEGPVGSRIFRMEWSNVGFYNEWEELDTTTNRISFQMWLYEGTNVIEYRFGENTVDSPILVHFAGGPLIGLGTNAPNGGGWESLWLLNGDPAAPTVELYADLKSMPPTLDGEPASGTVYRFTPTFVHTDEASVEQQLSVYPTQADEILNIHWRGKQTTVQIHNAIGQQVCSHQMIHGIQQIDIASLGSGFYTIEVIGDGQRYATAFIKN
ncbi:MAG: T9SS type A sorting domain-containing protein [Flavobacteriales bacterium]